MPKMRGKLVIKDIKSYVNSETIAFRAICPDKFGDNGSDENNTFSRYTPQADLTMVVNNPALVGKFTIGDMFYVDFTPVEE